MPSNARELGKLLARLDETGENPEFPFVVPGYAKLTANPRLAFTRPSGKSFAQAQRAIVALVTTMRNRLDAGQELQIAGFNDQLTVDEMAGAQNVSELNLAEFETAAGGDSDRIDADWAGESRQSARMPRDR